MSEQPPVVDITGLVEGAPGALERVARDLAVPCQSWGAFHVAGHGIPEPRLARFEQAMRDLFALPEPVKQAVRRSRTNARGYYDAELTKNRPDWKEVFDYGAERRPGDADAEHSDGVNQWPAAPDAMRQVLLEHFEDCERVGLALLRALCASLGLAPSALDGAFGRHTGFVRLNRYVACPDPAPADAPLFPESGRLGVHHHTDAGALTLVYQDDVAGLQIEHEGRFVTVDPIPGAFALNLGDMLQVWSNDRYRSPLHRVITHRDRTRHSAPFFLNPDYEVVCAPLEGLLAEGERPRFRPVSWAHFRDQRSAGDYADQGTEIQIDHFRVAVE